MDALSDVLRVVGLTGGIFLDAAFTAPWSVTGKVGPEHCRPYMAAPTHIICLHYVVEGRCVMEVEGHPPLEAGVGHVVLLPRNDLHTIGSGRNLPSARVVDLVRPADGVGLPRILHGGGGERTELVCGFLGGEAQLNPLVATLPAMLTLDVAHIPGGDWIARSFRYAARELADGDPGAMTVMTKMSELLFVEAVRRYVRDLPDAQTGWLAGLRDPPVGRALALLHTRVGERWTAEDLARQVNLSRSAFTDRFTRLIGQPPMHYLAMWRMQVAAHKLREGKISIAQIAFDVGYDSEVTFTRAFKREFGLPPATWRRRNDSPQQDAGDGASS